MSYIELTFVEVTLVNGVPVSKKEHKIRLYERPEPIVFALQVNKLLYQSTKNATYPLL